MGQDNVNTVFDADRHFVAKSVWKKDLGALQQCEAVR
jgi:hypothetical protein